MVLKMKKADLHMHSYFSDGHHSPEELVLMAKAVGISCIALTDHDTLEGNKELIVAGKKHNLEVIPGIEISSNRGDIVGLFIDHPSPALQNIIDTQAEKDKFRVKGAIKLMQKDGFDITYEEVRKQFPHPSIGLQHLVETCMTKGFSDDFQRFYKNFRKGNKYCIKIIEPTPEESMTAIKESGGAAIFAHPWLNDFEYLFNNLKSLTSKGLLGIEDETSLFRPETFGPVTEKIRLLCDEHNLLITKGSDFHFKTVGAPIGEIFCDYKVVEEIKKRIGKD